MNKLFSSTAPCARLAVAFCLVLAGCGDDEGGPVGTGGGGGEGAQGGASATSATSATSTTSTTSTSAGGAGGGGGEGGLGSTSATSGPTTGTSGGGGAGDCATCGEALSSPEAFEQDLCSAADADKAFAVQACACGAEANSEGACNDACPQFCSAEAPPDATCTACLSEQCATALAACQGG